MEKGYYKPELEEFCPGFKIEIQNIENAQWGTYIVKETDCPTDFDKEGDLTDDRIRVKLLDRADIEAEGFIYRWSEHSKTRIVFSKDRRDEVTGNPDMWRVFYNEENQWLIVDTHNTKVNRFVGRVRNRTEFKKLLKQLGI